MSEFERFEFNLAPSKDKRYPYIVGAHQNGSREMKFLCYARTGNGPGKKCLFDEDGKIVIRREEVVPFEDPVTGRKKDQRVILDLCIRGAEKGCHQCEIGAKVMFGGDRAKLPKLKTIRH